MICEQCQKNQATMHYTQIINGVKLEKHLCTACAAQQNNGFLGLSGFGIQSLLSGLMDQNSMLEKQQIVCPHCEMTYRQFKRNGKLGCAGCYQAFAQPISELLEKVHGRVQHSGKAPEGHQRIREIQNQIQQKRDTLKKAIELEDYESAASLRDEIKLMEQTGGEGNEPTSAS